MPHLTPPHMLSREVKIDLAGCGGNGSQMLTGLARLNHAIKALGHPGLRVRVFDPDTVSEANMGRQLFGAFDVGHGKAHVLVHRINGFFGLRWEAHQRRYPGTNQTDLLIVCVDSAKARASISKALSGSTLYVMDMGNRAADGQVLLGQMPAGAREPAEPAGSVRLPYPYAMFPELVDAAAIEDDTPSCGLAEALARQELFVNQAVVTPALSILWEFFRHGRLTWHGAFVNLRSGAMRPIAVPAAAPVEPATEEVAPC